MAKIRITENELREIIRESVLNEMEDENMVGALITKGGKADWDSLTPQQQKMYAKSQAALNPVYGLKYGLSGRDPKVAGEHYQQRQATMAQRAQRRADRAALRAQAYPQNKPAKPAAGQGNDWRWAPANPTTAAQVPMRPQGPMRPQNAQTPTINESQLKQIIRESIENVLNEALWDPSQSFGSNLRNLPGRIGAAGRTMGNNFLDASQGVVRGTFGNTTGMQGDMNQINNRSRFRESSRDDLIGEIMQREKQIATLSGQVATLTSDNATLSGQVTTLSGQVATLTTEVGKWKGSYYKLKKTNDELVKSNDTLTSRLKYAQNQIQQPRAITPGTAQTGAPQPTINQKPGPKV